MKLEDFYHHVYDWIYTHGPRIILGVLVYFIGRWIIKLCRKWVDNSFHKNDVHTSLRPFMQSLIITALQIILILLVMQVIGIQMTIFAAGIASFGVAIGLALSGTLQNFAGGVLILLLKPFQVGDYIVAQGQEGVVSSIQIFYTLITTPDNKTVIVPNSKLSNEVIINISREGKRRLDIEIKFVYASDMEHIQKVVQQSVNSSPEVLKDPTPSIGISVFDVDGFKIVIQVWVNAIDYNTIRIVIQKKILKDLKDAGIKLPGMV